MNPTNKYFFQLVLFISIWGCKQGIVESESTQIIQAKWAMYYMNYNNKAVFFEDTTISYSPLECDLNLRTIKIKNDTQELYFSFINQNIDSTKNIQLLPWFNHVLGIGFIDSNISYPIYGGFEYEFLKDSIETRKFMKESEQGFIRFIKTKEGKISPWLKEELIRRKIKMPN
jgi:hypothetical protein